MSLVAGTTLEQYKIVSKLGAGGMGEVYLARDTKLNRDVAIKILKVEREESLELRRRFMSEAQAASAFNHPNIITIYEIFSSAQADVIVMEFVAGETLRHFKKNPPPFVDLLKLFRQVAEGLAAAHAGGIVHRDIKPDNIMVRADGYVKILDFGVARLTRNAGPEDSTISGVATLPGTRIGTPRYMSPEQARGEFTSTASDIFSMGIVFQELATGHHPFATGSETGSLTAILFDAPAIPSQSNLQIPPAFDALLGRMLAKEPLLRPSAAEVRYELEAILSPDTRKVPIKPPKRRAGAVGREAERRIFSESFQIAAENRLTMLCIAGEPGMGKTTLIEEFLTALEETHATAWIGRGRCSERLGSTDALLPVLECLETILRGESGDVVARLMRRLAPLWYLQIAPSLGDSTVEVLSQEAKAASRERMMRELALLLEELGKLRPIVLFVDDVHWADTSTCDLIANLALKCDRLPMLLLCSYRPTELQSARHPFLKVRLDLESRGSGREVVLEFLARSDVERYMGIVFPRNDFPEALTDLIFTKTEGNPLFMVDMVRYLKDRRILVECDGLWSLVQDLPAVEKEMPSNVRAMIQVKIDRFTEAEKKLLLAASVQGVIFDSAVLANALQLDPIDTEEQLQALQSTHNFVRQMDEMEFPDRTLTVRFRFVHVFYQNVLYGSLTPSRRVAMSKTIAETLVSFSADKLRTMAADLAFLFESARDPQRAAIHFGKASRNAAHVFAYPEAALLASRGLKAVSMLPPSVERDSIEMPLSLTLGISLMVTKGFAGPELEKVHLRSRELCIKFKDERRLFPLLWALWTCYAVSGKLRRSIETAEEMFAWAQQSKDPMVLIEAHHAMGNSLGYLGRLAEGRNHLEAILSMYDPKRHVYFASLYVLDPSVSSLGMLSRFLGAMGFLDQAIERATASVALAERLSHPQSIAYARFFLGWAHYNRGELESAQRELEAAIVVASERGMLQIYEWSRVIRASLLSKGRDHGVGIGEIRKSLDAQRKMHSELERPYCLCLLADALLRAKKPNEALVELNEALRIIGENGERTSEPEVYRLRGNAFAQMGGEQANAETAYQSALASARQAETRTLELRIAISYLRFHRGGAKEIEARKLLAGLVDWFQEGRETPYLQSAMKMLAEHAVA